MGLSQGDWRVVLLVTRWVTMGFSGCWVVLSQVVSFRINTRTEIAIMARIRARITAPARTTVAVEVAGEVSGRRWLGMFDSGL